MTTLPTGIYTARVIRGSEQYAVSKNGDLQLALDMRIETPEFQGEEMTTVLQFAGKAKEWSLKKLRLCGWSTNDIDNLAGIDANPVPVRVFDEEYNGKSQRKIEISLSTGKFKFQQTLDPRQLRAMAALLRRDAASIAIAETRKASDDSDVPF